ncbi:DUF4397 domain-containing protein [Terrabacter sp. NPDC000476]|uniref:DUF4397 domain-containing protein n=1 Tax=Terrabacter sp. NPDC000476 TaxID=3154258 RepID=UPI00331DC6BD
MSRGRTVTVVAGALAAAASSLWSVSPSVAAPERARVFVVQGLPGRLVDVSVDGRPVATGLVGASLSRAVELAAGAHTVTFSSGGSEVLRRSVDLRAGSSSDLVLHLPVDPSGSPVLTVYDNTTKAVPRGKASVTVAHTAAVPPADVRVNGKVLFANIANGEALNLVVPADTYTVDIVPAGADSPTVLGPLDLTVKEGSLNRVFAVGDPQSSTMRAVVQVLPAGSTGSRAPDLVDTGTGGQAASRTSPLLEPLLRPGAPAAPVTSPAS